ncbi:glycoside hydrolase/deacetylase [Ascodesmis nigricans]|uniref:Glycoside hydrolase/deacetylase n=1 Tax=Ascodesmis nigricans TaxID=341454 RepID=A0A4V6RHF9_9PEZI|nr:glycoside hydrolase/deacetylase [Ascodesmis nigricans]
MKLSFVAAVLAGSTLTTAGTLSRPTLLRREAGAITPNGMCGMVEGGDGKGYKCGTAKPCCSKYGWCGNSDEHCGTGCQNEFGTCKVTAVLPTLTDSPSSDVKSNTTPAAGKVITACTEPNTIALTYDDGPHEYTGALLDLLKTKSAKATFFINGANFGPEITKDDGKKKLIKRMIDEGHQIGSHTWAHENLDEIEAKAITESMKKLDKALQDIIGKSPTYMRPPFLACKTKDCIATMATLNYINTGVSVDTLDWKYNKPETYSGAVDLFKNTFNNLPDKGSMLVLMHDVHENTVKKLTPDILNLVNGSAKKFKFVTVGECLGKKPDTWYQTPK